MTFRQQGVKRLFQKSQILVIGRLEDNFESRSDNENLPEGVLIAFITHDNKYIAPRGDTELAVGDHLMILANKDKMYEIKEK